MFSKAENALIMKINEILNQEGTVLFVGSGISCWSGLPSWWSLVKQLADFVEEQGYSNEAILNEINNNNLLVAASLGVERLDKIQFKEFLKRACKFGEATPHKIHEILVSLGPRCFITTNYDQLLEESLRSFRKDISFQVITNRQPIECATIIQIREKDYVFKPHGDINDTDSIILTHEQYRSLYETGSRGYTLNTLETILVTRPIVFVGFGLTDPDFVNLITRIKNIYNEGGTCLHYAILPDVSMEKIEYYFRNYGVRIISYKTLKKGDNSRDHSGIFSILNQLGTLGRNDLENEVSQEDVSDDNKLINDTQVLSLLRLASGMKFSMPLKNDLELPLRAIRLNSRNYGSYNVFDLLDKQKKCILVGNPGAGKTYSFKKYCNRIAESMKEWCVQDSSAPNELIVPIYLDLKIYNGDIWGMAESKLPFGFSLESLIKKAHVIFVLDSFNEMPRIHFENARYETDLTNFFSKVQNCKVIIGSRTTEGLNKLDFPVYSLEEIDRQFVEDFLHQRGSKLSGHFRQEVIRLLQKPFFFRLYFDGKVHLSEKPTPKDFYESFFNYLNSDFSNDFDGAIDIRMVLKQLAYIAVDEGKEALDLADLQHQVKTALRTLKVNFCDEKSLISWLVETKEVLIPAPGSRLSFFHQSITEYLAAMEMANLYKISPGLLDKCLKFTRWDQALFLVLGNLQDEESDQFMEQVFETDIILAIRSSKYVEFNQEIIVSKILNFIMNKNIGVNSSIAFDFSHPLESSLPVSEVHVPLLLLLLKKRGILGAVAIKLLGKAIGKDAEKMITDEIFENPDDYNLGNSVGEYWAKYLSEDEFKKVIVNYKDVDCEDCGGLIQAIKYASKRKSIMSIEELFGPLEEIGEKHIEIVCEILGESTDAVSTKKLLALIKKGYYKAVAKLSLKFIGGNRNEIIECIEIDDELLGALLKLIKEEETSHFSMSLFSLLISINDNVKHYAKWKLSMSDGPLKLFLLYCLRNELDQCFREELASAFTNYPEKLFVLEGFDDFEWDNHQDVIEELLKMENFDMLMNFMKSTRFVDFKYKLSYDDAVHLLKWVDGQNEKLKLSEEYYWGLYFLGEFLMKRTTRETKDKIINLFNQKDCPYRYLLGGFFVEKLEYINTEMLSADAIDYFIAKLSNDYIDPFESNIGSIATESFVQEYLLPLVGREEEPLKSNLKIVLISAGKQHRKRYILNV